MTTPEEFLKELHAIEIELVDLQKKYREKTNRYYEINKPFQHSNNTLPQEKQDIDDYLTLIHRSMCSGGYSLLDDWGIKYAKTNRVLTNLEGFKSFFKHYSNPKEAKKLDIGEESASYFQRLYESFEKLA